jgi:predicted metalloprotease
MLRGRESGNIEDVRGLGGKGIALGGGGLGMLVILVIALICGIDPRQLLEGLPDQTQTRPQQQQRPNQQSNDDQRRFAASVLGSTEDVWNKVLPEQAGRRYVEPKLVLFTDQVQSACGYASSASGPFYCPGDQKLYLDFSFFRDLKNEFRAEGDFAQAYVIAHEVGHHVQNLLGTMSKVNQAGNSNQLSVALELQADCYAGVWAFYANKQGLVEAGDPEEALRAAAAVGDDMIQKRTQGRVVPESFTHGSARERASWFLKGYQAGDMRQCNTFGR